MRRNNGVEPIRVIVNRRIDILLSKACEVVSEREADSKRYVKLSCKLSMRHRIAMGATRKKMFCKKCFLPLVLGKTVKIEKNGEWENYICRCGEVKKMHATGKKK